MKPIWIVSAKRTPQGRFLGALAIQSGSARVVLCGGTESMSNAPYLLERARAGYKLGNGVLVDSLLRDGLIDAFGNEHMAVTAERLAERYGISRDAQDLFAARSQQRYATAHAAGHFRSELVPVDKLDQDEHPRPETTVDTLATLRPAFNPQGTVTAGNASGLNDGAAMLVICDEERGKECGLAPLMVIAAMASVGCEPSMMGLGPAHATRRASGARLLVHLAHRRTRRGLARLCVGGGMGCAVVVQRP